MLAGLAARYKDDVIEFCSWNAEYKTSADGMWKRDKEVVITEVLGLLDQRLAFDPFRGPPAKTSIGFIERK